MKSGAVVKTFSRKAKKARAQEPASMDIEVTRHSQNATDSSQDCISSQVIVSTLWNRVSPGLHVGTSSAPAWGSLASNRMPKHLLITS